MYVFHLQCVFALRGKREVPRAVLSVSLSEWLSPSSWLEHAANRRVPYLCVLCVSRTPSGTAACTAWFSRSVFLVVHPIAAVFRFKAAVNNISVYEKKSGQT